MKRERLAGPTLLQSLAHLARLWPSMTTSARLLLCARLQARLLWNALQVPLVLLGAASVGGLLGLLPGFLLFSGIRALTGGTDPLFMTVVGALGAMVGLWRIFPDLLERGRHWRATVLHSLHQQASKVPASDGVRAEGGATSALAVVTGQASRDLGPDAFGAIASQVPKGRVPDMFGVGAVVLVIAAITVPSFISFGCRAKMSEAKVTLKRIHTQQRIFHDEHKAYGTLDELKAQDESLAAMLEHNRYYAVSLSLTGDGYGAVARDAVRGVKPPNTDLWTMDATGDIKHPMDGCSPD